MSSQEGACSLETPDVIAGESSSKSPGTQPNSLTDNVSKDSTHNDEHASNFIDDGDKAYIVLLNVFQYLSTKDLCSALRVCKVWNKVGSDNIFWKRVNLNDCTISDCNMMGQTLKKYGTEILDLSGNRFPTKVSDLKREGGDDWSNVLVILREVLNSPVFNSGKWYDLCDKLAVVTTLTEITVVGWTPSLVIRLAEAAPQLKSLSAYNIKEGLDYPRRELDTTPLKNMRNLQMLKLEINKDIHLKCDGSNSKTTDLKEFNLTDLSITKAVNVSCIEKILPTTLVSLELGEFHCFAFSVLDVLPKLKNLMRLRLQMCKDSSLTNLLLNKIPTLPDLSELELVNFEISKGFSEAMAKCINLKSLLIIPIYKRNALMTHALTNTSIISAINELKNLQVFVWVVTDQLIENTNTLKTIMTSKVKVKVYGRGDSISFFKSYPDLLINVVPLDAMSPWPYLKFKIFKVSFSSTWKLSLRNISI